VRIREPSADKRCETDDASLYTLTPSMPPTSSSWNNKLDKPSTHKETDKEIINGSPRRKPLVGAKLLVS
jgi:hypothetical protein